MNEQVKAIIEKFPPETIALFGQLRQLIFQSASSEPQEALWARMPTYSVGGAFVRLIPFRDHINVEATAILRHKDELAGYKLTPKGMLQIGTGQLIPEDALKEIFAETLRS